MARKNSDGGLESQIREAIEGAMEEYVNIIWKTANDIYNSCIKQYYASYTPIVYKRHGNIKGSNLYRANSFTLGGMTLDEMNNAGIENLLELDDLVLDDFNDGSPEKLLKYGSKRDIRSEVLAAVLSGQRGITVRRSPRAANVWPMSWTTSYPNSYSQYNYWSSGAHTIEEIIDDFEANVIDDTSDLLDKLIDKQFK